MCEKWTSILNHVADIHEGHGEKFPKCTHEPLEHRMWITKGYLIFLILIFFTTLHLPSSYLFTSFTFSFQGSKAHKEITRIITNKILVKDIAKLSETEQTALLEVYHKVVIQFAPKHTHYFYLSMKARLVNAGLWHAIQ